jgi:carbonic anhydrase
VDEGQHPTTLFIGCSDSRLVPYLLTGAEPGELFLVRNVGAFVPPWDGSAGFHGTAAAIEYAVLALQVQRIVVCGHSHCGGIRALYAGARRRAEPLALAGPGPRGHAAGGRATPEALRRTEQRAVVLQLERLMAYPMVREAVEAGRLTLHGWHVVIEDGEVHVFDLAQGCFVAAAHAPHAGTGPYAPYVEADRPPPAA